MSEDTRVGRVMFNVAKSYRHRTDEELDLLLRYQDSRGDCYVSVERTMRVFRRLARLTGLPIRLTWEEMKPYFPDYSRSSWYECVRALKATGLVDVGYPLGKRVRRNAYGMFWAW